MKPFRFHWGMGLTLAIVLFCGMMLALVYGCLQQDVFLVSEDYYGEELRYQEKIDKMNNLAKLAHAPKVSFVSNDKTVFLALPEDTQVAEGTVRFFRPSDSRMDFEVAMASAQKQTLDARRMQSGLWKVMLDWKDPQGTGYYNEQSLVVP